jgi:hypothetical protein
MNQPVVPGQGVRVGRPGGEPEPHVVRGLVAEAVTGPLAGVVVEAYDRVLQRAALNDVRVGTDRTGADGRYAIRYTAADGKAAADLTVRALDGRGGVIATSRIHYQATEATTIDLTIGGDPWQGPSEHDQLMARLADVPLAEIDDEIASFVASSRGIGDETMRRLRVSAQIARDHQVPPELMYALGSQGMPTDLRLLLGARPDELREALGRAMAANAVSRRLEATLDRDLAALRGTIVAHSLRPSTDPDAPSLGDLLATGTTGPDLHNEFVSRYAARPGSVAEFWTQLSGEPAFRDPAAVADLRFSLQLALLTLANLPLLRRLAELRRDGRVQALSDLTTFDRDGWRALLVAAAERDGELPIPRRITGDTPEERVERYLDTLIEPLITAFPTHYLRQRVARAPDVDMSLVRRLVAADPGLDPSRALPEDPAWGDIPEVERDRARASWTALHAEITGYPGFEYRPLLDGDGDFANPVRDGVHRLLTNLADVDLRTAHLDRVIAERGGAGFDGIAETQRDAVVAQLKTYQRLLRVTPRAEQVEYLLGTGFHTARSMALTSPRGFVKQHSTALGGEQATRAIHDTAIGYAGAVQLAVTSGHEAYTEWLPWVIPGGGTAPPGGGGGNGNGGGGNGGGGNGGGASPPGGDATLESLFGPLALCDCEHCRSVYSPAAYLVDLLHFLDPPVTKPPLAVLRQRRPDLETTLLTCANTNTPLPYIDLVNEVLEAYVHLRFGDGAVGPNQPVPLPAYDTGEATAEELRAVPQHLLEPAYDLLETEVFPMELPFHRPLAVVRSYLDHLGVPRERLLRTYGQPSDDDLAAEMLGMSGQEYRVVAGLALTPPRSLWEFYGYHSETGWLADIARAPEFTRRTRITFTELVELVKTWFVNRAQAVPAERISLASPGECDPEHTTITNLDQAALDRAHRFLRLWRRLGWSMADLDRAVFALGGTLDPTTLRRLAKAHRVATELRIPLADALALWGPIGTWGRDARYLSLFQNRGVAALDELTTLALAYPHTGAGGEPDPDVKSTTLPELATTGQKLSAHLPAVLAALRVTEPDLELILGHLGLTPEATLSVATLSALYRYPVLARALRLRIPDLVSLLHLTKPDPFQPQDPAGTLAFIEITATVRGSGFSVAALDYLYRHAIRPTRTPAPVASRVAATLAAVRAALQAVRTDLGADDVDDPDGDDLRAKLGLAFTEDVVTQAMGIILGEPDHAPANPAGFLQDHFAAFADPQAAAAALLHPPPLSAEKRQQHLAWVRERLLPWLRETRSRGEVAAVLADALGLDPALVRHLLEQRLAARVGTGAMMDDFLALADLDPDQEPGPGYFLDYELLHKAALIIDGFRLNEPELRHLLDHAAGFAGFTLDGLPLQPVDDATATALFAGWERLRDLVELRDGLAAGELTLVDLFEAQLPPSADPVAYLSGVLVELSGWDQDVLGDLVAELGLQEGDFRTEVAIHNLRTCLEVARRTGVGVATLTTWATDYPDPAQARAVVRAVKARYDEQRWLEVARSLNDPLREAQRDALVAYLVPRMGADGVATADHLYEHFLIDVGMQSCMATSRIKQALSSVQQFVQRCLLGLEPAVEPDDIDGERWKWCRNYRVWEANRKVFLYPENWIEPELRLGKSPFFRQLETDLLQDELTGDAVEQALLGYLRRLDEVARLDVRGMYWQEEPATSASAKKVDVLHVIARTPNPPHRYFYRRFEDKREWTPWEPVDLDIQSDHPIPVVYNRRLYLFWPAFTEKPKPVAQQNLDSNSPPVMRWEVALSWSEYRQGTWSAVYHSGAVPLPPEITVLEPASRYALYVDRLDSRLVLSVGALGDPDAGPNPAFAVNVTRLASFVLDGCHSSLEAAKAFGGDGLALTRLFTFPKWADTLTSTLASWHRMPNVSLVVENGTSTSGRPILGQTPDGSRLVRSPDLLEAKKLYPFFFSDPRGAYLAYPVPTGTALPEMAPDPWSVVIVTDFLKGAVDV